MNGEDHEDIKIVQQIITRSFSFTEAIIQQWKAEKMAKQ